MNFWWVNMDYEPMWLKMEKEDCLPYNVGSVLFAPKEVPKKIYRDNPIIYNNRRIWKQIVKTLQLDHLSLRLPIMNNPLFKPSILDGGFRHWDDLGIKRIEHLYRKGKFILFQELQDIYGLFPQHLFRYLQIRDYIKSNTLDYKNKVPGLLDDLFNLHPNTEKLIAHIYNIILDKENPTTETYRQAWEKEIGLSITKENWEESLQQIHRCSLNARHTLIQFKVLYRLHYSKTKLNSIFHNLSSICDKCKNLEANLTHSFATCSKLNYYWTEIFKVISEVLKIRLDPDPKLIILGILDSNLVLTGNQRNFFDYCLIIGKKIILKFWKGTLSPTIKMWAAEMLETLQLERIRFVLLDKYNTFEQIWSPSYAVSREVAVLDVTA